MRRARARGRGCGCDRDGVGAPIDRRFALVDLMGIGAPSARCARKIRRPAARSGSIRRSIRAPIARAARQFAGGLVRADRRADFARDRAGVESFLHPHEIDAGLGVAGHQRALNRRGAAPARQQRSVEIEAAQLRRRQNRRRQDQAVGDDDGDVGGEGAEGSCVSALRNVAGVSTAGPGKRRADEPASGSVRARAVRPVGASACRLRPPRGHVRRSRAKPERRNPARP